MSVSDAARKAGSFEGTLPRLFSFQRSLTRRRTVRFGAGNEAPTMFGQLLQNHRRGFSMVESLMAVAITAIAGAALLTSISAAVRSSTDSTHAVVARGLAVRLMDEIAASEFPPDTNTTPSRWTRSEFNDIDDYNNWSSRPPITKTGQWLGAEGETTFGFSFRSPQLRPDWQFLYRFTREVQVERVAPAGTNGWTVISGSTNFRRVFVRVKYTDGLNNTVTLAENSRIFSHVSIAP